MREHRPSGTAWYARVHWGLMLAMSVGLALEFLGTSTLIGSGATAQVEWAGFVVALVGVVLAPLVMAGLWNPLLSGVALIADAGIFSFALWKMQGWSLAGRLGLPLLAMVALVAGTPVVRHGIAGLTRRVRHEEARPTLLAACVLLTAYGGMLFAALPQEPALLLMPLLVVGVGWWKPLAGTAVGLVLAGIAPMLRSGSPVPEPVVTLVLYWPVAAVAVLMGLIWISKRDEIHVTETVTGEN